MKNSLLLTKDSTFEMAIEALDQGGMGFLAFVDDSEVLIGIITDGDIRRALLKKQYSLDAIINKNPEVMSCLSSRLEIISRLKALHRRHMPLVDNTGVYKGIFSLDEIDFITRQNPVVIMAGGLGSRLGELTKDIPKPMLTIGNRPMLQHLVEQLSEQGFREFIFCVNYKKHIIKDYFGDGEKLNVKIKYIEENNRLGTAGALSLIEDKSTVPFIVINADVLTNLNFVDLIEYHEQEKSIATMCVRQYNYQIPYGVVNSCDNKEILSIEEKPVMNFDVNAGIYVLQPEVLCMVPNNTFFDMPSLFELFLKQKQKTTSYRIHDYWIDIGKIDDLNSLNKLMNKRSS